MAGMSVAAPMSHGTSLQMQTRRERDFSTTEMGLPMISTNTSLKLLNPAADVDLTSCTRTKAMLATLGRWTHHPQPVSDKDAVWLLDNVAYPDDDGQWQAEFVAATFTQKPSERIIDAVASVAEKVGVSRGDAEEKVIENRLVPFLMDVQPGKLVEASFGDGEDALKLGPGGRNGISSDLRTLPDAQPGDVVTTRAQVPGGVNGFLEMRTHYASRDGWALVSDIDDTIKITYTSDPVGILRSTFVSNPTPTHGMPEFYAHLERTLPPGSPFFYLSASPYNLYPFLRNFRETHYPLGQLILRDSSWMTVPGLLSNLTLGTEEYKTDRLKKIHSWLPAKKLICIGDSTQSDPEAYGNTYRAFPGWVRIILIRKVTNIAAVGIAEKNNPERFEKAFHDVPKDVWQVFEDPAECREFVARHLDSD